MNKHMCEMVQNVSLEAPAHWLLHMLMSFLYIHLILHNKNKSFIYKKTLYCMLLIYIIDLNIYIIDNNSSPCFFNQMPLYSCSNSNTVVPLINLTLMAL